jgi:rhamnosyl/mannosyltransferase
VQVVCINHADRHGKDITWSRYGRTKTIEEEDRGVQVTRVGRSASVARLDMCPALRPVLRRLCSEIDVLHLHTPNPTMLLALAMLRPEVPLVITHHSDIVRQRVLKYAMQPFENLVYRRAAKVLSTSPAYVGASAPLARCNGRVSTLPLGVDLDAFLNPSPAALAYAKKLRAELQQPLWLAVGRCVYYKNLKVAIEALPHVPGKLMIIGHGPLEGPLRHLARQLGVSDRVIWKKYVTLDELAGAYRAATGLWFPSNARSEAFGLVQVEAMASGCPVINAHIEGSGVSWVSQHEQTGLTVPVDNPHAFATAAQRLLNEPGLRDRLAAAAPVRARKEFDHRVMGERSLDLYERALGIPRVVQPVRKPISRSHIPIDADDAVLAGLEQY